MSAPPPPPPLPPSGSRLQTMLQTAVQSVQWTYSLFWQLCPQQGILVWADGYYNGAIKTRKTVQPMEVSTEEASLQRSQQLRELYDSLSIGETNQPPRRPCAALSPEDLTESEWFYLMCVSFSFSPGVGLPGKAYTRRQHVWLTGVNEVDSKVFSRAILAKSASIQTVVCIPLLDGVVEFGTVDKVQEDLGFVQHVKTFFVDHNRPPPKPALSEHSTSNPAASSDNPRFQYSPPAPAAPTEGGTEAHQEDNEEEDEEDDEEDEAEAEAESDSEAEMGRNGRPQAVAHKAPVAAAAAAAEPSELMQLEMSEDIRLGSPDDGSNNLDSDFPLLAVSQARSPGELQRRLPDGSYRAESARRWPMVNPDPSGLPLPPSGPSLIDPLMEDMSGQEDTLLHCLAPKLSHKILKKLLERERDLEMEYSSSSKHLVTFSLFSLLIIASLHTKPTSASRDIPTSKTNADFVRTSCVATTYPKLCFSSLSVHASAIQSSPELLASTALSVTLSSAKTTSTAMVKLSQSHGLKPREAAAMRDCIEELSDSVDELQKSMAEMGKLKGSRNNDFKLLMNDIQTWVSAALTDESTCTDGFDEKSMSGEVKTLVRGKIVNVAQLTSNALALINKYALIHG